MQGYNNKYDLDKITISWGIGERGRSQQAKEKKKRWVTKMKKMSGYIEKRLYSRMVPQSIDCRAYGGGWSISAITCNR